MLSATDISVSFRRRDGTSFFALDHVTVNIPDGAAVAIVGESGSGKSTLARVICGLQKPCGGKVVLDGADITGLSVRDRMRAAPGSMLQMVFQDAQGALNPRQRVGDSVAEVLRVHRPGTLKGAEEEIGAEVRRLFEKVGLAGELMSRYPAELSGGQCQRVCVARALALRPTILIGDEPVSALDVSVQARILRLFSEIRDPSLNGGRQMSLLLITHDLAVVSALCDYVYVLEKGKLVESGLPSAIFKNPAHPYTRRLLAAARAQS